MSAGEGAPGAESQPGTERGWGRWWGVEALGGEATCLGREGKVFPGAGVGSERTDSGSRGKGERGTQWGEREGAGLQPPGTLIHPLPHPHVTSWVWGLGSNPTSARAHETHLSGFTALSLFFGLKSERDRQGRGRGRESEEPSILLLPQIPGLTQFQSWKPGLHCGVPPCPAAPKPGLWELRSGARLAPAFTLAVFFQGHLAQLTARVTDHEYLYSRDRGHTA